MKYMNRTLFAVFFFFSAICLKSQTSISNDSLRYDILLNSKMLESINLTVDFIPSFDITPDDVALLYAPNQFYVLGWGGLLPLGAKIKGDIADFAITPNHLIMTISEDYICRIDSNGNLIKDLKLPNKNMKLSAGKEVMFVMDQNENLEKKSVYLMARGGKYAHLFDTDSPINSLIELNDSLIFASKNGIFSYDYKTKAVRYITSIDENKTIKSISADTTNHIIYFSTNNAIYSYINYKPVIISEQFGGLLKFYKNGLMIFNSENSFFMRIENMNELIIAKTKEVKESSKIKKFKEILTNESIIQFVKDKVSEEQIIYKINNSPIDFKLDVNSMVSLSKQNVSSAIIIAMENAMNNL